MNFKVRSTRREKKKINETKQARICTTLVLRNVFGGRPNPSNGIFLKEEKPFRPLLTYGPPKKMSVPGGQILVFETDPVAMVRRAEYSGYSGHHSARAADFIKKLTKSETLQRFINHLYANPLIYLYKDKSASEIVEQLTTIRTETPISHGQNI